LKIGGASFNRLALDDGWKSGQRKLGDNGGETREMRFLEDAADCVRVFQNFDWL